MNKKYYTEIVNKYNDTCSEYRKKGAKWQEIKYTKAGDPFVTYNGIRYHLDLFMRNIRPDEDETYDGSYSETYSSCLLLKFEEGCERAKVIYSVAAESSKNREEREAFYNDLRKEN